MSKPKKPRGLATLSKARRLEIASMGGASVPAHKRSFATNPDLAIAARALVGKKRAKRKEKRI